MDRTASGLVRQERRGAEALTSARVVLCLVTPWQGGTVLRRDARSLGAGHMECAGAEESALWPEVRARSTSDALLHAALV